MAYTETQLRDMFETAYEFGERFPDVINWDVFEHVRECHPDLIPWDQEYDQYNVFSCCIVIAYKGDIEEAMRFWKGVGFGTG